MKAAVYTGPHQPLEIQDLPKPAAGPGEAVVKVAACGLCHTDLHYLDHGVPTFKKPPLVLGHEAAGWIDSMGPGVAGLSAGQAVLVPAVLTCGACAMCQAGRSNICERMQMLGNHIDGAFAEFVRVPAKDLIPLADGLDPVEVSIVADAVTTAYHAVVNRAEVRPGDRVVILGCGGVGLSAVQFAALVGAHVTAVDVDPSKLELAKSLGAAEVLNPKETPDAAKELRKRGGANRALECIGKPETLAVAHGALKAGGRLCIVGFCDKPAPLQVSKIMFQEQEVVGSLGCRPADFPRVLSLVRSGRFRLSPLITARRPLAEIGAALEDLRAGRSVRSVLLP